MGSRQSRLISSVLEAVSRASGLSFQRDLSQTWSACRFVARTCALPQLQSCQCGCSLLPYTQYGSSTTASPSVATSGSSPASLSSCLLTCARHPHIMHVLGQGLSCMSHMDRVPVRDSSKSTPLYLPTTTPRSSWHFAIERRPYLAALARRCGWHWLNRSSAPLQCGEREVGEVHGAAITSRSVQHHLLPLQATAPPRRGQSPLVINEADASASRR